MADGLGALVAVGARSLGVAERAFKIGVLARISKVGCHPVSASAPPIQSVVTRSGGFVNVFVAP